MNFADKLNSLFELSHAEGKELAAAMNITPPQISKMRRGGRGLPKNPEAAQVLALFFARRLGSDYQRDALSKAMRVAQIRSVDREEALAEILLDWLSDRQDPDDDAARRADDFLRQFGAMASQPGGGEPEDPRRALAGGKGSFMAYYGDDGKRLAVEGFLSYVASRRQPCTIDMLSDEPLDWLFTDPDFSRRFQKSLLSLTGRGCSLRRIAAPILDMDQAFQSLNRWLPLYLTGKATSYYFKRMRDNLNRLTLFAVPGMAVLFSFSVGNSPRRDGVTFFTTDERTVACLAAEFDNYLALCEPIMNVYTAGESSIRMHACMMNYENHKGNCLQRSEGLSFITLPWDVATTLRTSGPPEEKNEFLSSFAQRYKRFKTNLEQYSFTDYIRLAEADQVMAGKVVIPGTYVLGNEAQYYTPVGYLEHLRSTVYLLEHRANYHAALRRPEDGDDTVLYIKEGYCAILALAGAPFSTFEVSERYLVDAFAEYLRRQLPPELGTGAYRRAVIAEMRALIETLEKRIRAK